MLPTISILCTGSEILDARIFDTNSNFIASSIKKQGFNVSQVLACRDDLKAIKHSLEYLASFSDIIIVSGGLGPTSDDVTRDAIAEFSNRALEINSAALEKLKALYLARKRNFEKSNLQQAYFPKTAQIIDNPVGTAAGFLVKTQKSVIISLPGVPLELKAMLEQFVIPWCSTTYSNITKPQINILKIFGLSEAQIGQLVEKVALPENTEVAYKVSYPEVTVRIASFAKPSILDPWLAALNQRLLPEFVFSLCETTSLAAVVVDLLKKNKATLALAESCTGGLIGSAITDIAGSSEIFMGSAVCYSNQAKEAVLQVDTKTLATHGAVSHETAKLMAQGARKIYNSDVAISVTGISGPGGGSAQKPVGTFFLGFSNASKTESFQCFVNTTRDLHRRYVTFTALDLVRRYLLGLSLVHPRVLVQQVF